MSRTIQLHTANQSLITNAASSSYALTASYAANAVGAGGLSGGTTNYIPLWSSTTSLSSSNIYQSAGNIGIGTTNPNTILDLGLSNLSNTTNTQILRVNAGGYNQSTAASLDLFNWSNNFGQPLGWRLTSTTEGVGISVGRALTFNTIVTDGGGNIATATERVRIDSTGYVGIGTSSPTYPLQIRRAGGGGSLGITVDNVFGGSDRTTKYLAVGDSTSDFTGHVFYVRNGNATDTASLAIRYDGYVGIGTTTPSYKLHVNGTSYYADTLNFGAGTNSVISWTSGYSDGTTFIIRGPNSGSLILQPNSTQNGIFISSSGNVGVGTTSPVGKLTVNGYTGGTVGSTIAAYQKNLIIGGTYNQLYNTSASVMLLIADYSNDTVDDVYPIYVEDENNVVDFFLHAGNDQTTATKRAYFGGKVGIGTTSPTYKLDVIGNMLVQGTQGFNASSETATLYIGNSDSYIQAMYDGGLDFYQNNTFRVRIQSSTGNVGIGTTNPSALLDVNGSSIFRGVMQQGNIYRYSTLNSISVAVDSTGWIKLATVATNAITKFMMRNGSNNSEEVLEFDVYATYVQAQNYVNITRQTYYQHVLEIRLTGSEGGNPTVYIRCRTSDFAPTFIWQVASAWYQPVPTIHNIEETPGSGRSFLLSGVGYFNSAPVASFTGSLGIGTTNPQAKLDVVSTVRTSRSENNAYYSDFITNYNDVTTTQITTQGTVVFQAGSTDSTVITAKGTNKHIILTPNGTGGVGIGTTSPSYALQVNSGYSSEPYLQAYFNSTMASGYGGIGINGVNQSHVRFYINGSVKWQVRAGIAAGTDALSVYSWTTGTDVMYFNNSGNIGIGTTSPGSKLQVAGDIRFGTNGTYTDLRMYTDTALSGYNQTNVITPLTIPGGGTALTALYLKNAVSVGTNRMDLIVDGYVGIGTASPQNLLHIQGSNVFARISNLSTGDGGLKISYQNSDTHGLHLSYNPNNALSYIDNTYPTSSGTPYGNIYFRQNINGTMTSRMMIEAQTGNVGIGTTSPTMKLNVVGGAIFGSAATGVYVSPSNDNTINSGYNTDDNSRDIWLNYRGYLDGFTRFRDVRIGNGKGSAITFFQGSTGRVGIGTESPSELLHVVGNIINTTNLNSSGDSGILVGNGHRLGFDQSGTRSWNVKATGGNLQFTSGDGNGYYTFTNGVGIATTSPYVALDVRGGVLRTSTRVASNQLYPVGHYTPGETVFEIDPTWSETELRRYFNTDSVSWVADSTAPGGYAISIVGGINVGGVYSSGFPYIPVDQDDTFYMECWIKNVSGTNGHYMGSIDFNESFTSLGGNPGSFGYWVMSNTNPGSSWTKVTGYIGGFGSSTGQFVAGTKYWTPQALFNYTGGGTSYISGWKAVKVTTRGDRYFMSGSIGIGTKSPATKVEISDIAPVLRVSGLAGSKPQLQLSSVGVVNWALRANFNNASDFTIYQDSTERVRIDSSGNVGINTTNPNAQLEIIKNSTDATLLQEVVRITTTGRSAGGGTNNRGTLLSFSDSSNITLVSAIGGIRQSPSGDYNGGLAFYTNATGGTNATSVSQLTERVRIDSSGNVGIGITTPLYPLHLRSSITNTGLPHLAVDNMSSAASMPTRLLQAWTGLYNNGSNGHNLYLSSNDYSAISSWEFNFTKTWSGVLTFGVSSDGTQITRHLTINSSGNVGIGTTSPAHLLDVNGSVRIVTALGVGTAPSSTTGEIRATNEITAYYSSDKLLKENITPLNNALNKLLRINGVEFDWTDEHINKRGGEDGYFVRKHDVGVIAQEIQEVLPEVVAEREDGYLAVRYEKMVPLLIEAIKELQAEVAELKTQR